MAIQYCYFIPVQGQTEADVVALKKAYESLDRLASSQGVNVKEIVFDFEKARQK